MNKYELLKDDTIEIAGKTLYRIRALRDIGNISKGSLGGYVESEKNLSHEGNCWVSGEARVFGKAWVFGEARVYDEAEVFGDAEVYGEAWVTGNITNIIGLRYKVTITDNHMIIGCKCYTFEEWRGFTNKQIHEMDTYAALYFWNHYRDALLTLCEAKEQI